MLTPGMHLMALPNADDMQDLWIEVAATCVVMFREPEVMGYLLAESVMLHNPLAQLMSQMICDRSWELERRAKTFAGVGDG